MKEYIVKCEPKTITFEGEIVRCKDCVYCNVVNTKYAYAYCMKHGFTFYPFEDDTRTNYCSRGEIKNKGDAKSATTTDFISRQNAIEAMVPFDTNHELRDTLEGLPPVEPKTDLVNRSDVLELAKSGVLISNDNYEKVCKAINGLPSCHSCRECETVEQKPVCEDAISRADTLKALCAECDVKREDGTDKEAHCTEYAVINDMPPVEPKRPKGEWIEVEDCNGDVHYKCDQCGEEWTFPYGTPKENNANFCPNCGVKMKKR